MVTGIHDKDFASLRTAKYRQGVLVSFRTWIALLWLASLQFQGLHVIVMAEARKMGEFTVSIGALNRFSRGEQYSSIWANEGKLKRKRAQKNNGKQSTSDILVPYWFYRLLAGKSQRASVVIGEYLSSSWDLSCRFPRALSCQPSCSTYVRGSWAILCGDLDWGVISMLITPISLFPFHVTQPLQF